MRLLYFPSLLSAFIAAATFWTGTAFALDITPFRTSNLNPMLQIYGLPSDTSPTLTPGGHWRAGLTQDIASNYTSSVAGTEQILLDGELYRTTLSAGYGISDSLELGLELPFVAQGGGFLDSFINHWHKFWGLPQGGRDTAPNNRLDYRYTKDGVRRLDMSHATGGIGDISILAAYRLFEQRSDDDHDSLALRGQLKLPTGDSSNLLGSGGTDFALFLTGSTNRKTGWGTVGVFGSAGGMYGSDGDILQEQRENLVGYGTVGLGWSPADWIGFKVQCNLTSPFYRDSSLSELGKVTALLTTGGTLRLPGNYLLDIGVGEDVAVATAPDVTFHLGLSKQL